MNTKSIHRVMLGCKSACALVVLLTSASVMAKKSTPAAKSAPADDSTSTTSADSAGTLSAVADPYKQLINQGQFQQALTETNVAIAKQTSTTDKADKYALLMIKGEALLHLKAVGSAQDAFASAAKVGPDDKAVSVANGTVILIKHAGSLKYQPKVKSGESASANAAIDIVDPTSRKDAFSALFTDMIEPLKPKVAALANSTSLSAITAMAKPVDDARDVEIAGTGSDPQSKDLLEKLATPAAAILSGTLKPFSTQVDNIGKDAAKHQKLMGRKAPVNSASLTPPDADQLDTIASEAQQVSATCTQLEPMFGDAGDFKSIKSDADKIVEDVNKILKEYKHQTVSSS